MLNIKELTGPRLKKALGLRRAVRRYHNKNKSGGNFGINLYTHTQGDYEITGDYDPLENIRLLSIGQLYQPGMLVCSNSNYKDYTFEYLISQLKLLINNR